MARLQTILSALTTLAVLAPSTCANSWGSNQETLGLVLSKHPSQARAGGLVTIRAKAYNRGDQALTNVNVLFSVPDYFTVERSSTTPKLKPACQPVVEEGVLSRRTNIYWLNVPVQARKARSFAGSPTAPSSRGRKLRLGCWRT